MIFFIVMTILETTSILVFLGWYLHKRIREELEARDAEAYLAGFRHGKEVVTGNEIIDMVVNL